MSRAYDVDPSESGALASFKRVLNLIDALPEGFKPTDGTPLRAALPGGWPSIGDLRSMVAALSQQEESAAPLDKGGE